jgi:cysteine desulfurase
MVSNMIYLDNAATTALYPQVLEAMLPYLSEAYANPSSVYSPARKVRGAIDDSRRKIATAISAQPEEIFFTAGGTESNNWAIKGVVEAAKSMGRGQHIITTSVEHHAVFHVCEYLTSLGCEVTYLPVNSEGLVTAEVLENAIRPDTCLVSIIHANNEIGTISPMAELSKITKNYKIPLHTDAVQAVGHIPVDVDELGVDLLSLSAHKFHGPKGIGALYVRKGTRITPMIHGGAQEKNRRAGTENVAGIVGMGVALEITMETLDVDSARVKNLRDTLINEILTTIPHIRLNGAAGANRLPGNVNISFRFIEGESLLLHLDMQGIYASTGSACSSGALEPSHVLMALGLSHELANGAIRFSLGRNNTDEDVHKVIAVLRASVDKLRQLSPLYDDFMKKG